MKQLLVWILPLGFVGVTTGLVRSHCTSGRSYDRPTRWTFMACLIPRANYDLAPKINVALYAFTQPSPTLTSEFSRKHSHPIAKKFCHNTVLQTQNSDQLLSLFPWLHTANRSISSRVPSSLPNPLPYFQPTFTRRPSGHCPGTFRAVNFFLSFSLIIIGVVPFYFRFCFFFPCLYRVNETCKRIWPWSEVPF